MYCGKCGNNNPENVKFCSKCGAQLDKPSVPVSAPVAEAKTLEKKSSKTNKIVGMAIVAVGAVLLILLLSSLFGRGYKTTVKKYIDASYSGNGKTIVSLIPKKVVKLYLENNDCEKSDLIDDINYTLKRRLDNIGKSWTYTYKITDVEDMDKDELKYLKEDYKEDYGIAIKNAKKVKVEMSITVKDYDYNYTDSLYIPVVKIGSSWYLDGENMSLF